jgi:hypothetical protein
LGRFIFITEVKFFIGGFWVEVEISDGEEMILRENVCEVTCYYADWRVKLILAGCFAFTGQILCLLWGFSLIAHFCAGYVWVGLIFMGL